MDYPAAVAWLSGFANLERRPTAADWSRVRLERVERLVGALGNPHRAGRVIHIAGTKGKGSTAAMVEAVLRRAGYRTGLFTSPHLVSHRERIRVSGEPIPREAVADLVTRRLEPAAVACARDHPDDALTFFDLHTSLAFLWFAEQDVEWAVVEVGLGGRLDATNVVQPAMTAITLISYDHVELLGADLGAIAAEKAGIIKPGVPVVSAAQPPEAAAVIARVAAAQGARVVRAEGVEPVAGGEFVDHGDGRIAQRVRVAWDEPAEVLLPLIGPHQVENAAVARTVLWELYQRGDVAIPHTMLVDGLESLSWPGRVQVVGRRPWVVLDGAHNPVAAARLRETLELFPHHRRWLVLAAFRDKDFAGLARELCPGAAGAVVCGTADNPRASSPEELRAVVSGYLPRVVTAASPAEALGIASAWAGPDDLVVATGSLYLVGELLRGWYGSEPA